MVASRASFLGCLRKNALAILLASAGVLAVSTLSPIGYAQTTTTGALSGLVTDASGAAVPNATVTVTDTGTAAVRTVTTNAEGRYTVGLLPPATYKVSASAANLASDATQLEVSVGTTIEADIRVTLTGNKTVVEVSATTVPLLDTQNVALATTFNEEQIQNLPTPGGDVTTVAFTLPGVVVNAGGAYGNFSSDGLPGISNLFVLNGFDNQDPFLNLNNSGSSNLTLGQGELAEATVVQNGYNSQYGRAAGAVIQYTTKSGTNAFHGMLDYNYNGSLLNANGWFAQQAESESGDPLTRPHAVANQWAANVGGPIIKDKVFFFGDYEGLRYVLPGNSGFITFPSPALNTYIMGNVPAAAQSFYGLALADYQKSPAYKSAIPVATGSAGNQDQSGQLGCGANGSGGLTGIAAPGGGTFGVNVPCMVVGTGAANNINKEWLFTGRADWNISDKHKIYGRYKMDRGSQPTSTSFIDPLFSAVSIQPEYEGQFNDSYQISPTKTNVFVAAANWYTAYFGPVNPAASYAELPIDLYYTDAGFDGSGVNSAPGLPGEGVPFYLTQGRNVTQYQIEDDLLWIHGKHSLRFGANFRRDLVSDYDSQIETVFPYSLGFSLGDFAAGKIDSGTVWSQAGYTSFNQAFAATTTAHLALYNIGAYVQDEYQVLPNLKLTMGVRIDRTGNPLCHNGCFSSYAGAFPSANASLTSAYDYDAGGPVQPHNWHPFPKIEVLNFQPRFGFNYSIGQKTEIRGGAGLFSDLYPAGFLDGVIQNFPNYNAITVHAGALAPTGGGTAGAFAAKANSAIIQGFNSGSSIQQINTALTNQGVPFSAPTINAYFPGTFHVPEYLEYSMQVQRQLTKSDAVILTYAGNYGYNEVLQNPYVNAASGVFCNTLNYGGLPGCSTATQGTYSNAVGTFGGFATTPADPRFGRITAYTNNAHSNYSGGMVQWKHNGHGVTAEASYTLSHGLDFVSNGGEGEPFNGGAVGNQLTANLGLGNLNYSNSDYDIRNNVVGDIVYDEKYKSSNRYLNPLVSGWSIGGKTYWRTGEPFTIVNSGILGGFTNLGGTLTAQLAPGLKQSQVKNLTKSNSHYCAVGACLDITQFVPATSQSNFGDLRRNSFYGPHYVNTDLLLTKSVFKTERMKFVIGANAYNVFNKVNFGNPDSDVNSSAFGRITGANAPPTSPYGSFQGAAVTQRLLQLHGKFTF
jgi:hypothetical protein